MNINTPSLAPGARSLPSELRTPRGHAFGWNRLHGNLTPVTQGGTAWLPQGRAFQTGVNGIGADQIPVDLPLEIRTFPNMKAATAHDALNAVAVVQARYSPKAAAAVTAVLQRITGQASDAAVAALQRFLARQASPLAGLGYYDANGVWQPDESPYPVVMSDPATASNIDWGSVISGVTTDITGLIAVTQGGSVSASGNIYGSPGTATAAAQAVPYGTLNVSGAGVSGILSSPLVLILLGVGVLMVMSKR